jgi:hypothetical protein
MASMQTHGKSAFCCCRLLLERFSGDHDVQKARAEFEGAQKIEETLCKDFDGIDCTSAD